MKVIFDLDQTIIDSSIAFEARRNRDWNIVYSLIPRMRSYSKIVNSIKDLIDIGVPVAIVSSSPRPYCEKILDFLGITGVTTVCYHDTVNHKPDPEPIILALNKMGNQDDNVVIAIGDEEKDVIAAQRAGVFGVLGYWGNTYSYYNWNESIIPEAFCQNEESLINLLNLFNREVGNSDLQLRKPNIFQLLEYYPISKKHDMISSLIFNEIKNKNDDTLICDCFCRNVSKLNVFPHAYGIFVVPSSSAGRWNNKLINYVVPQLISEMGLIDCSKYIVRHTDHEKQAFGGTRDIDSHLETMRLQEPLPDHIRGAIVIDDITTTGNIFEACMQLLCGGGIERGNIVCAAIGGTV